MQSVNLFLVWKYPCCTQRVNIVQIKYVLMFQNGKANAGRQLTLKKQNIFQVFFDVAVAWLFFMETYKHFNETEDFKAPSFQFAN